MKKCKNDDCENERMKVDYAKDLFLFSIPFTSIEIRIMKWSTDYDELCEECHLDRENHRNDFSEELIYQCGYDAAVRDYENI